MDQQSPKPGRGRAIAFRLFVLCLTWLSVPAYFALEAGEMEAAMLALLLPFVLEIVFVEWFDIEVFGLGLFLGWAIYIALSIAIVFVPKRSWAFALYAILVALICLNIASCHQIGRQISGVH